MKKVVLKSREDWLANRIHGLGGSEVSALLGMNPYMDIQELYDIKKGIVKAQDISNKEAVEYGIKAESHLRELFALDFPQYQVIHEPNTLYIHDEYDFILGSFDGILIDKETGDKFILEIKTTNILQSMHNEKWNQKIPNNYFCQLMHYLLIANDFKGAILCAQLKTNYNGEIRKTTRHYTFKRKNYIDDIEYLKNKEIDFWQNNIIKGIKPSMVLPAI